MSVHDDEFPTVCRPSFGELRKASSNSSRVEIDLSTSEFDALERLVRRGTYGATPDDVALYLISRGIDDLVRVGVL